MQRVYVEWLDAQSETDNSWTPIEKLKGSLALIHSCGFLIKDTPDVITVAGHYGDEEFSGEINIPVCNIKKMEYI